MITCTIPSHTTPYHHTHYHTVTYHTILFIYFFNLVLVLKEIGLIGVHEALIVVHTYATPCHHTHYHTVTYHTILFIYFFNLVLVLKEIGLIGVHEALIVVHTWNISPLLVLGSFFSLHLHSSFLVHFQCHLHILIILILLSPHYWHPPALQPTPSNITPTLSSHTSKTTGVHSIIVLIAGLTTRVVWIPMRVHVSHSRMGINWSSVCEPCMPPLWEFFMIAGEHDILVSFHFFSLFFLCVVTTTLGPDLLL